MKITRTRNAQVLWVEVNRPDALNAIDFEVMEGLEEALDDAEKQMPRVFVLSGAGDRSFISGGDLKTFSGLVTADDAKGMASRMVAILARIEALPCWTLACINGDAYGGGTETLLAFDLRVAAPNAHLGFTQSRFHLPPGWGGLTRLVEAVGASRAQYWLATGSVISAQEAHSAGLVHEVHDHVRQAVQRRAEKLALMEPELVHTIKDGIRRATTLPRQEAIAAELEPFANMWAGEEHHRRVKDWMA
jgi:enoyl-CoA hydratase